MTFDIIFSKPLSMASVSFYSAFYSIPLFLKARPNKLPKNEPILLRARLYHGVFYYYYQGYCVIFVYGEAFNGMGLFIAFNIFYIEKKTC